MNMDPPLEKQSISHVLFALEETAYDRTRGLFNTSARTLKIPKQMWSGLRVEHKFMLINGVKNGATECSAWSEVKQTMTARQRQASLYKKLRNIVHTGVRCMFAKGPNRKMVQISRKHYFHPFRVARKTFANRSVLKTLQARPSTGFLNAESIEDVVKNHYDIIPSKKHDHSIHAELEKNPKLQHLQYLKTPVLEGPQCTEKCDTKKLCDQIPEFSNVCSHPKGHSIMTPHECYACEALREAEEEGHRIKNRDKRAAIKRKAEFEEDSTGAL